MYEGITDKVFTECPHCGSKRIRKSGKLSSGYQRYHCAECNKKFSSLTFVKLYHESGKKCPKCGSTFTYKRGLLASGKQRYACNTCGLIFSEDTKIRKKINEICPHCGSSNIIRHGIVHLKIHKNKQKYCCKDCGKTFVHKRKKKVYKVLCPSCGTKGAYKWTRRVKGTEYPYYNCLNCHHKFTKKGRLGLTSLENANIIKLFKDGMPLNEIAKLYNRKVKTMEAKVKGYYDIARERRALSPQTVRDIIYFGLGASVPTDYLSEYLHVSERVVKSVIFGYKRKVAMAKKSKED